MDEELADLRYRVEGLERDVRDLRQELDLVRRTLATHTREHGA